MDEGACASIVYQRLSQKRAEYSVDAFGKSDFRPELAAVSALTLILHRSGDKPVPFSMTAIQAASGIRQAKMVEYD